MISKDVFVVTDQLPYPPRNGITIPVFNYLSSLKADWNVVLFLLIDVENPPKPCDFEQNEIIFGKIVRVYLRRRPKINRLIRELLGIEMFQHGWVFDSVVGNSVLDSVGVLVSPMSAVAKLRSSEMFPNKRFRVSIAAVNDCTAAEYYFRGKQSFGGIKLLIKGFFDRLRSIRIAHIEQSLLSDYDHVLMQTKVDADLMRNLVGIDISKKVTLVPNGIRADLFSINSSLQSGKISFVAELSGEYAPVAAWLITEVWPLIIEKLPDLKLLIVGKGADSKLLGLIQKSVNVNYISFVDDISDLYKDSSIVLSPIFKGYGLINKTLEAMASGIPVVGGTAAFNGIVGFENGRDGILCQSNSATEFSKAVVSLASNLELRQGIGKSGRILVKDQFRWESSVGKIEELLNVGRANDNVK